MAPKTVKKTATSTSYQHHIINYLLHTYELGHTLFVIKYVNKYSIYIYITTTGQRIK